MGAHLTGKIDPLGPHLTDHRMGRWALSTGKMGPGARIERGRGAFTVTLVSLTDTTIGNFTIDV